ncbi:hypothetical protein LOK49_Contig6G00009 [Camellia lanceoleosa]|nr:hypothetical protein LOK49_Contig6G00009 [Camellia lanceoleosa]
MDLGGKMEGEVEIKCDADELFQICFGKKAHIVRNLSPDKVSKLDLHEEGKVETFKEKVTIDEENKTVHLTAVEGHCLDLYKSYNIIYQIIPKGETNVLKITIEYEKRNEDVPPPQKYMDFIIDLVKDLDAKLVMA